jgi:hypothetical protein
MTDDIFRQGKSAVIYARVSTKGQAESGVSIDTQLKTCRSWCRQNGVEIVGEFHDDGISGTTNDRDNFGQLIGSVVSKQPHYLVVYDSSRLTRKGPDELNRLKAVLDMYRCEAIYARYGGLSGSSEAALHLDTYKSATDSLFVKEQTRKTRDSVDKNIAEGRHVSRSVGFAFSDDIPLMPDGRILREPREREKRDPEGRIVKTVTPATVVKSVSDFFALVDRGASVEVIAEMWGIERHTLSNAVRGKTFCRRESCDLPDRSEEYRIRLKRAKDNGSEAEVREYILYCKTLVSAADMVHEINALRQLLLFIDNPAVDLCLAHNPMLKPKFKGTRRKESMSDALYDLIFERSRNIDPGDFHRVRAYALVMMGSPPAPGTKRSV